ncbi:MAG: helix-turn-helix domain-containing protein [Candidatus Dormibacteria bacterium]
MASGLDVRTSRALVTIKDAAAYLSCSRRHVERLLARGELPRVRLGRSVRIVVADLDRFIAAQRSEGC